jgi:hypothetical protein
MWPERDRPGFESSCFSSPSLTREKVNLLVRRKTLRKWIFFYSRAVLRSSRELAEAVIKGVISLAGGPVWSRLAFGAIEMTRRSFSGLRVCLEAGGLSASNGAGDDLSGTRKNCKGARKQRRQRFYKIKAFRFPFGHRLPDQGHI